MSYSTALGFYVDEPADIRATGERVYIVELHPSGATVEFEDGHREWVFYHEII